MSEYRYTISNMEFDSDTDDSDYETEEQDSDTNESDYDTDEDEVLDLIRDMAFAYRIEP